RSTGFDAARPIVKAHTKTPARRNGETASADLRSTLRTWDCCKRLSAAINRDPSGRLTERNRNLLPSIDPVRASTDGCAIRPEGSDGASALAAVTTLARLTCHR